ncbi:oligopeptide transport ATP-binding protein OppD [Cutibacterium acnes JCM 18920]|nr:oligopeptide transport ATP-binding protein OppD [Cutibacterium acnes JCM 18920]
MADDIAVMYCGRFVEHADVRLSTTTLPTRIPSACWIPSRAWTKRDTSYTPSAVCRHP